MEEKRKCIEQVSTTMNVVMMAGYSKHAIMWACIILVS